MLSVSGTCTSSAPRKKVVRMEHIPQGQEPPKRSRRPSRSLIITILFMLAVMIAIPVYQHFVEHKHDVQSSDHHHTHSHGESEAALADFGTTGEHTHDHSHAH